jgi:hypothetical protein
MFICEHLLKIYPQPIAIVESEKTAILAAAYRLNLIGLQPETNNLSRERCQPLKGKTVFFFLMLGLKFGPRRLKI